jgi:hypothetical protein
MDPTTYIASGALLLSVVNSVQLYRKSRRDAFTQRLDRLAQITSEFSVKNTEARLLSARFEIVAVRQAGFPLRGEQRQDSAAIVASLKRLVTKIELAADHIDESVNDLHAIYRSLSFKTKLRTAAPHVEEAIALAQAGSDDIQRLNDSHRAQLHVLETNNQIIETQLEASRQTDREYVGELRDLRHQLDQDRLKRGSPSARE